METQPYVPPRIPRVYIPHEPSRWDYFGKQLVSVYDLTPAAYFGELVPMLERGPITLSSAEVVGVLRDKLQDFTDDDFILCIGDPVIITSACMVAAQINGGYAKMLRFDRLHRTYQPVEIDIGE